jgi:hypothetical protein
MAKLSCWAAELSRGPGYQLNSPCRRVRSESCTLRKQKLLFPNQIQSPSQFQFQLGTLWQLKLLPTARFHQIGLQCA